MRSVRECAKRFVNRLLDHETECRKWIAYQSCRLGSEGPLPDAIEAMRDAKTCIVKEFDAFVKQMLLTVMVSPFEGTCIDTAQAKKAVDRFVAFGTSTRSVRMLTEFDGIRDDRVCRWSGLPLPATASRRVWVNLDKRILAQDDADKGAAAVVMSMPLGQLLQNFSVLRCLAGHLSPIRFASPSASSEEDKKRLQTVHTFVKGVEASELEEVLRLMLNNITTLLRNAVPCGIETIRAYGHSG